jgi:hypothetical protein
MIPKIIHHIWIQGYDSMPIEDKNNVDSIRLLNPDWQSIVWDNNSISKLLSERYPDLYKIYLNVDKYPSSNKISNYASQSDIARWVIVSIFGGCYMDVDVSCVGSLNKILEKIPSEYHKNGIATGRLSLVFGSILAGQFFISSYNCDIWQNVLNKIRQSSNKEDIGGAFTDGAKNAKNLYVLPEELLTMYHCGITAMCMIPIKMGGTGRQYCRQFLYVWCKYKIPITIGITLLIILLIFLVFYYLTNYNKCISKLGNN